MLDLINFIGNVFQNIYNVLNVQFFGDFPITYIELIMITVVISFIFKFIFGGFKEAHSFGGVLNSRLLSVHLPAMSNSKRKEQLNKEIIKNEILADRITSNIRKSLKKRR